LADRKRIEWLAVGPAAAGRRYSSSVTVSARTPGVMAFGFLKSASGADQVPVRSLDPTIKFHAAIADGNEGVERDRILAGRAHGLKASTELGVAGMDDVHAGFHGQAKMGS